MQEKLAEAERRIEEARRTQAEALDLGDLELSELPANLGDLSHLKALYLGSTGLNDAGELEWAPKRKTSELTDLSPLAGLRGLQKLHLNNCEGVTNLSPLAGLQALQNLNLQSCRGVTDLEPLAGLQALQSLNLYGCRPGVPEKLLRIFTDHPRLTDRSGSLTK